MIRVRCGMVDGSPAVSYFDDHLCSFILINMQNFESVSIIYDICIMSIIASFSVSLLLVGLSLIGTSISLSFFSLDWLNAL